LRADRWVVFLHEFNGDYGILAKISETFQQL